MLTFLYRTVLSRKRKKSRATILFSAILSHVFGRLHMLERLKCRRYVLWKCLVYGTVCWYWLLPVTLKAPFPNSAVWRFVCPFRLEPSVLPVFYRSFAPSRIVNYGIFFYVISAVNNDPLNSQDGKEKIQEGAGLLFCDAVHCGRNRRFRRTSCHHAGTDGVVYVSLKRRHSIGHSHGQKGLISCKRQASFHFLLWFESHCEVPTVIFLLDVYTVGVTALGS